MPWFIIHFSNVTFISRVTQNKPIFSTIFHFVTLQANHHKFIDQLTDYYPTALDQHPNLQESYFQN